MIKEVVCTRVSDKVFLDVYPFYEGGERILCPRQNPISHSFCYGCEPGHASVVVKEVDKDHILLDPNEIPEWKNE